MIDGIQRPEMEAEIVALSKKQINAVQTATFLGWDPAEIAAYEVRYQRLVWLRRQLA